MRIAHAGNGTLEGMNDPVHEHDADGARDGETHEDAFPDAFDVSIRDDSIRLGQFLKLANLIETGGLAKEVIASGQVLVNGEVDTRRGRHLKIGDVVELGGMQARVSDDPDEDDFADDDFDPEKWRNL